MTLLHRRHFLQASATLAAVGVRPVLAAPSERVTVGVVGLGSRGFNLMDELLRHADVQIVAVCDVDRLHYRDRPWGEGAPLGREPAADKIRQAYAGRSKGSAAVIDTYADFRQLCQREDIDAVVVATPDHWHALCTLEAIAHGKDVYCEKPVTHTFGEGLLVCDAVAKHQAVFQTGSQQRSDARFRRSVEIVRNGHLGKIRRIEVGLPPGYDRPQGDDKIQSPPDHLDYDFWCGPAEKLPYRRATHHRWWRGHRQFGGGVLMDWIGHHNDIAQWAIGAERSGPVQVRVSGWTYPDTEVYNAPHHYEIISQYADGTQSSISSRHAVGVKWVGEDGWLFVTRGKWSASNAEWLDDGFQVGSQRVFHSPGHMRNFLDCVKSRQECVAPAEIAHRSITPGHLAYVADALERGLRWDAAEQRIMGDDEADRLLRHTSYRPPWKLPLTS